MAKAPPTGVKVSGGNVYVTTNHGEYGPFPKDFYDTLYSKELRRVQENNAYARRLNSMSPAERARLDPTIDPTSKFLVTPSDKPDMVGIANQLLSKYGYDPDAVADQIGVTAQQRAKENRPWYRKATRAVVPLAIGTIGGTLASPLLGAAGLSGTGLAAGRGAVGGALSGLIEDENLLSSAAKGAGLGIAGDIAKNALFGDGGFLGTAQAGQGPSAESVLNAPTASPEGFSAARGTIDAERLLAAPAGGFTAPSVGSSGGFVGSLIDEVTEMSPLKLLAGGALLGGTIYSARKQANAAEDAARMQSEAGDRAIASQERMLDRQLQFAQEARNESNQRLQPFVDAGTQSAQGLTSLVNDPAAQMDYVMNNPFYQSLADDAQQRLFSNQAARGKLGSGETAKGLQDRLVMLGQDLLNQSIQQRQNLTTLGANAAAGQATGIQNTASNMAAGAQNAGNNIAGLLTQIGNANAAGRVGAANAGTNAFNNLVDAGLTYLTV